MLNVFSFRPSRFYFPSYPLAEAQSRGFRFSRRKCPVIRIQKTKCPERINKGRYSKELFILNCGLVHGAHWAGLRMALFFRNRVHVMVQDAQAHFRLSSSGVINTGIVYCDRSHHITYQRETYMYVQISFVIVQWVNCIVFQNLLSSVYTVLDGQLIVKWLAIKFPIRSYWKKSLRRWDRCQKYILKHLNVDRKAWCELRHTTQLRKQQVLLNTLYNTGKTFFVENSNLL